MTTANNKITGANAGGTHPLPTRTPWAARVAQFCRWTMYVVAPHFRSARRPPAPDRIYYGGTAYNAWSALHLYDYVRGKEGYTPPNSTAGYHAVWRVMDGRLLLEGFDCEVAPSVQQAVEGRPGGIHAHWFSGVIRLLPAKSGSQLFTPDELHLKVRDGLVESCRPLHNGRFIQALEEEYTRRGRAGNVFWECLVKKQVTRDWVRSLRPLTQKERVDRVLCRQSEMMGAFEIQNTELDRDQVMMAATLPLLIWGESLNRALELMELMP
jgi:hypothetical protein